MGIICYQPRNIIKKPITINSIEYYKKEEGYTLKIQIENNNKDINKYNLY